MIEKYTELVGEVAVVVPFPEVAVGVEEDLEEDMEEDLDVVEEGCLEEDEDEEEDGLEQIIVNVNADYQIMILR